MSGTKKTKIGIIGCGAIGEAVAVYIDAALSGYTRVRALCDIDTKAASRLQEKLRSKPRIVDAAALMRQVDLAIETASQAAVPEILELAFRYRKDVIILSVGALINRVDIIQRARRAGITIYVPSGAICGVDGLGALSIGTIKKITLTTSKPPAGFAGADFLKKRNINIHNLKKEQCIFSGSVEEAIQHFPKNINVAATLLLASHFQKVKVFIKADPRLKRNTHRIQVDAQQAHLMLEIQSNPSPLNPKTSSLAILSTQHLLKKIFSPFKIGS